MALMDFRGGSGEARIWIFLENVYPVVPELCQISLAGLQTVQTHIAASQTFAKAFVQAHKWSTAFFTPTCSVKWIAAWLVVLYADF